MADPEHPPGDAKPAQSAHMGKSSVTAGKPAGQLLDALTATDLIIRRLDRLLSTADGQERVLATVNYVASILQHVCAAAPWIAFQSRLGLFARRKGNPGFAHITSSIAASRFKALSSLASETRYNLRLFGLLPLWIWGSNTLKSPPADHILHVLTILQVISNVFYQILENIAYLASKGIISRRFVDRYGGLAKWDIWSTRGWFGHIFFQFFVLWRQHILRKRRLAAKQAAAGTTQAQEIEAEEKEMLRLEIQSWRKSLVNNTIWAPLCLHWCVEKGIGIPESLTGLISLMAGAWGLRDSWAATANV